MARGSNAKCRLCRREGQKLFLKGERCNTAKCAIEKRQQSPVPGMHGLRRGRKQTEYAIQLREKQRLKRLYGLREAQFRRFFAQAERISGNTGDNLLILMERRLANVIYRMGMASSREAGRKFVAHGHVRVNGLKVNRHSFLVKQGDEVKMGPRAPKAIIEASLKSAAAREGGVPGWVEVFAEEMRGMVKAIPTRDDIGVPVDVNLVVTYYSK